VPKIIKIR